MPNENFPDCDFAYGREHSHINVAELALLMRCDERTAWGLVRDAHVMLTYPGPDGAVGICAETAIRFAQSDHDFIHDDNYPGDLGVLEEWVDTRLRGLLSNEWFDASARRLVLRRPSALERLLRRLQGHPKHLAGLALEDVEHPRRETDVA